MILYEEGHPEIVAVGSVGRKVIEEMTDAHVMPKQIEVAVNVDETGQKVTRKQIYNVRHQYKLQKADGRTPIQMFAHLTSDARYVTRYRILDNTSEIIGIFWSNPKCISLLHSYPYVLVMDSTYNTNRYNYALLEIIGVTPMNLNFVVAQVLMKKEDKASYFWALECLRELYDANVDPTAIVTDRELGLMEPISVVFPRSPHLLCLFHIKKMVEAKVLGITKSIGYSKDFIVGRFATMIESPTVEDFCSNYLAFRAAYQHKPSIIAYIDRTWLVHKEKFVHAWTNKHLHFGNTTSNRAESAHSVLKEWLGSSRGGIDTLFGKIHEEIEGQVRKIRKSLEYSRTRIIGGLSGTIFKGLPTNVTHRCIRLLRVESMKNGDCCCAYQSTHGLLCSCQLRELLEIGDYLRPQNVHQFWQTLEYGGDGEFGNRDGDSDELDGLVTEIRRRDKVDQVLLTKIMHNVMYPEDAGFVEPTPNVQTKGRPKKISQRREKSWWEFIRDKFNVKPTMSYKNTPSTSSSVNKQKANDLARHPARRHLPPFMRSFVSEYLNIADDGNCGFRCVASLFHSSQDDWKLVRSALKNEISCHDRYNLVYLTDEDRVDAIRRIDHRLGSCGANHWMCTPDDLFAVAQHYRCIVSLYMFERPGRIGGCCTLLPIMGDISEFSTLDELAIIHMGSTSAHFVRVKFESPHYALPPLHMYWHIWADQSLLALEQRYASRFEYWNVMADSLRPPH